MPGCVPQRAVAAATDLGPLTPAEEVSLAFVLPWRDARGLDDLLVRLYDPADPLYGHYLTSGAFADRFGPDPTDVQAVVSYAQGEGLSVEPVPPNRLLVDVSASAAAFARALGVPIHRYRAPDGDTFLAPAADPLLPPAIASRLLGIAGFGDHMMRRSAATPGQIGPGSGPQGTLTPSDFRHAYQLDEISGAGAGQTLGLVELSGYLESDVAAYEQQYNLAGVPCRTSSSTASPGS